MFRYTDLILTVMRRLEIYKEIFIAIAKEVQANSCSQAPNKRGKETYQFFRNNLNRFFIEEASFRKCLVFYRDKEATNLLLKGLDVYKEGLYCCLEAINEQCEVIDEIKYKKGIHGVENSLEIINQACREACGGIESAHSVHKM